MYEYDDFFAGMVPYAKQITEIRDERMQKLLVTADGAKFADRVHAMACALTAAGTTGDVGKDAIEAVLKIDRALHELVNPTPA